MPMGENDLTSEVIRDKSSHNAQLDLTESRLDYDLICFMT